MTETAQPLNIYQRINAVRKKVEYVRKDKRVDGGGGGYMVVTHDVVTALLRPHLVDQNIIVIPSLISAKIAEAGATAKGTAIIRYEGFYSVRFVNGDSPSDEITLSIEAHALDQGDKAPGKALSYAVKYAMLKLFSLETGEDEEQRFEAKKEANKPSAGAGDRLSESLRNRMTDVALVVQDFAQAGKFDEAFREWEETDFQGDADAKVFAWSLLPAPTRSTLKRMAKAKGETNETTR